MEVSLHPINLSPAEVICVLQQSKTSIEIVDKLDCLNDDEPDKYKFSYTLKSPYGNSQSYYFSYEVRKEVLSEAGVYSIYHIGDILWVREDWAHYSNEEENKDYPDETRAKYLADPNVKPWTSIFFMPRAACRIFLKITKMRPEQLSREGRKEWVFIIDFKRIDAAKYLAKNKKFASWLAKPTKKKINYSTLLKEMWKKSSTP